MHSKFVLRYFVLSMLSACVFYCEDRDSNQLPEGDTSPSTDSGGDTDGDTDADTDTDTDSDTSTETDTNNIDLVDFESTSCLSWFRAAARENSPGEFYGDLECISWSSSPNNTLNISVIGYKVDYCAEFPEPEISQNGPNDIVFKFDLVDYDCMCCYNYTVGLSGIDFDADLDLTLVRFHPNSNNSESREVSIPLTKATEGEFCRYPTMDARCATSSLHRLCSDSEPCDDDLVCQRPADNYLPICMQPCEKDTDCASLLLSCQDGLCLLNDKNKFGSEG